MAFEPMPFNNAQFARFVSKLNVFVAKESADLALGMWNPQFCAASPEHIAAQFINEVRAQLDHIEKLASLTAPDPHRIASKEARHG